MYTRPTSQIDEAAGLAYAAARGFGLVIASDAGRPVASPLPFVVEPANAARRLAFHVARGNRLAELAAQGGSWLLVVMGPDAYVSPDWYASAEQVPTWLYETVHLSGAVRVMSDPQKRDHLDRLSATFEAWHAPKPPWTADKLTPARHAAFMQAIVAIEMTVEMVEGSLKLNQHKSDADHIALVSALSAGADAGGRAIAARMAKLRPHLSGTQHEALVEPVKTRT